MNRVIVKIQRPLASSGPPEMLVSDEDKTILALFPQHMLAELFDDELKIYHYASLAGGKLTIHGRAPVQPW